MTATKGTTIRLSPTQKAQLEKLSRKLGINEANVIRMAIARLAAEEGITGTER